MKMLLYILTQKTSSGQIVVALILGMFIGFCMFFGRFVNVNKICVPYQEYTADSAAYHASQASDQRRERVQLLCNATHQKPEMQDIRNSFIYVDERRKILYCNVPKVACTSWKKVLGLTTGQITEEEILEITKKWGMYHGFNAMEGVHMPDYDERIGLKRIHTYGDAKILEILETYYKFAFVRHPLDRLVSAYKDKIVPNGAYNEAFRGYHREVQLFKRKQVNIKYGSLKINVTFKDWIQFLASKKESQTKTFNNHWKSIPYICAMCAINYDFIGQLEHIHDDAYHVMYQLGLQDAVNSFPQSNQAASDRKNWEAYYDDVPMETLTDIKALYLLDFLMFDYNLNDIS